MASTTKSIKNERLTAQFERQRAESIMGTSVKEERLSKPYWEGETSKPLEATQPKEYLENTTTGAINSMEDETKEEISQVQASGSDFDDFDFVDHYGEETLDNSDDLLPDNIAPSAISCGFVGIGGGGGKMAKAFLDLGFNKTLLINTTEKDQPEGILPEHFLLLEGADGVGKDVDLGKRVLSENSAVVENTLRSKFGKLDWLFVLVGGGGGTGSSSHVLDDTFNRYLKSVQAGGRVIYVVSIPTAQELLNPTIDSNSRTVLDDVKATSHIVIDNERQLQLLRGKVGMLGMYPKSNKAFAKMLAQVFKLASEVSPVQSFDSKDLERLLRTDGRLFMGTTAVKNPSQKQLGLTLFQTCMKNSPCPPVTGKPTVGSLLLVVTPEMADDPAVSNQLESAISYVGGRSKTLFSGVYVRPGLPGLIAIIAFGGLK